MSNKLVILAGIPGSGKSTWARRFFPRDSIVSTDAIRAELYDGDYDPSFNGVVFRLFHNRIATKLANGENAVADSTALLRVARARLCDCAKLRSSFAKWEIPIHVVMFTSTVQGYENNPARDARWVVPEDAMTKMIADHKDAMYDLKDELDRGHYESITYIEGVQQL